MPEFPTKEDDISALAKAMMYGFQNHGDEFPSVSGPGMYFSYNDYISAREACIDAKAAAKLAVEEKNYRLGKLTTIMKKRLKKSQVDVSNDPEKLSYIGWAPRAINQPVEVPTQPSNLAVTGFGQGGLSLAWERPNGSSIVRNYIIERRQQREDEEFGQWIPAGTSYQGSVELKKQPRGIQLEYCVKAVNTSGESLPSNTAPVVL